MSNGWLSSLWEKTTRAREWPGNKTLKASYADRKRRDIELVDASFLALYLIFIRMEAPLRYRVLGSAGRYVAPCLT